MERPEQFLSSILFFLLFLNSCSDGKASLRFANRDQVVVKHSSGIVYVNDSIFTGVLYSLFQDQQDTLELSSFLNGREHGAWKQFHPNGAIKEIRYFENGKKQGEYTGWWERGSKKFIFHFEDDEYSGTCYEWDENGQLAHEANYINGHEEGLQRAWYANGKIKSNYIIVNGRRFGLLGTKNCKNVSDRVFNR